MNLSLAKNFTIRKLGEGGQLQMKVDAYDIFYHPNFGMPNPSVGGAGVGTITSAAVIFTGANVSRSPQLGAKLSF